MSKTIRSHKERVRHAKEFLQRNSRYKNERISIIDREAFVEYFLLEDIVELYSIRLKGEQAYVPVGEHDEKGRELNIKKFTAIINIFNAAIGAARSAISSGEYKKVWKAIHEGALMSASKSVKNLPELRSLASEMLRELSNDTIEAEIEDEKSKGDLEELNRHEENVRRVKNIPFTKDEIEEVIRVAEAVIPDRKKNSRLESNN